MNWKAVLKSIFPDEGEDIEDYMSRQNIGSIGEPRPRSRVESFKKYKEDRDKFVKMIKENYAHSHDFANLGRVKKWVVDADTRYVYDYLEEKPRTTGRREIHDIINDIFRRSLRYALGGRGFNKDGYNFIVDKKLHSAFEGIEQHLTPISEYIGEDLVSEATDGFQLDFSLGEQENFCRYLNYLHEYFTGTKETEFGKKCFEMLRPYIVVDGAMLHRSEEFTIRMHNLLKSIVLELMEKDRYYMGHRYLQLDIPEDPNNLANSMTMRIILDSQQEYNNLVRMYINLMKPYFNEDYLKPSSQVNNTIPIPNWKNALFDRDDLDNLPKSRKYFKELYDPMFERAFVDPVVEEERRRTEEGYKSKAGMFVPDWWYEVIDIIFKDEVEEFIEELYSDETLGIYHLDSMYGGNFKIKDFREDLLTSFYYSIDNQNRIKMDDSDYLNYLWVSLEDAFELTMKDIIASVVMPDDDYEEEIDTLNRYYKMKSDTFFNNIDNFPATENIINVITGYMNRGPSGIEMLEGEKFTYNFGARDRKDYKGRMRVPKRTEITPKEGKREIEDVLRERGRR